MNVKRLGLAAGLGLAAFIIFTQVKRLSTPPPPPPPSLDTFQPVVEKVQYAKVLVATGEIPFGARLNETHLRWQDWPEETVTSDYIVQSAGNEQAIEQLTGSVARSVIFESEPISTRKIVRPGEAGLMASLLTPGMRAVTTRISVDTAAGGFIQPGDRVDIILTTSVQSQLPTQGGNRNTTFSSTTIFENVKILAIDQVLSNGPESGPAIMGSTATFEMTQGDAELLQQSVAQGDLTLTLRPMSGSYSRRGVSHARVARNNSNAGTLTVYRNGQPQQVAIRE